MEHIVKAVCRDTHETIFEEVFENPCEAYMRYHQHTVVNMTDKQHNYIITLLSHKKSLNESLEG